MNRIVEAAKTLCECKSETLGRGAKSRYVEMDDGEKGYIVHSDHIFVLEMALKEEVIGFIVANGNQDKFRCWDMLGPDWTEDRKKAVVFVRRSDAEAVFAEDEDAWAILPVTASDL